MGLIRVSWCLLAVVIFNRAILAQENDTDCSKELLNLSTGFELLQTRLEQLQLSFMEVFGHIKELGEVVVNNQRTVEQNQLQTNRIVHVLDNQVASNVSQMVDYSKQILDLQTTCANHDSIREELLRINPTITGSPCHRSSRTHRGLMIPKDTNRKVVESCTSTNTTISGLFRIVVTGIETPVYCEMQKFGGGWLVIQQRFDGSENFYRYWSDYKNGFGAVGAEFWLGLEKIHQITKEGSYQLMLEFEDFKGNYKYARYTEFAISNESGRYALSKLGTYSGTAGDQLTYQKGMKFTTQDSDNDNYSSGNTAVMYKGAWWFRDGSYGSPNGKFTATHDGTNIYWSGLGVAVKYCRIMIKKN